jgi:hypothetical protein
MKKHTQRVRWRWLSRAVAGAAICGIAFAPLATGEGAQSPSPTPQACQLQAEQPEAPLKLNVVTVRSMAKSIAMEKEVFNCFDAQSRLAQVKDVETFIEIVDSASGNSGAKAKQDKKNDKSKGTSNGKDTSPSVRTVSQRIDIVTCVKDLTSGQVSCKSVAMALGTTTTPLRGCSATHGTYPFEAIQQPTHPVEMETVVLAGGLVKTVKVEKEVFECAGRIADLYLFTNVHEVVTSSGAQQLGTRFDGVVCFKDEARGTIASCQLFTPRRAA